MAPKIQESDSEMDIHEFLKGKYGDDSEPSSELSDAVAIGEDGQEQRLNYGSEEEVGIGSEEQILRVKGKTGSADRETHNTLDEYDSELEEEDDEEEEEEEEEDDEEIPGISDDEEEIRIEDPDEIDEDLELRDEDDDDEVPATKVSAPIRVSGSRESRKRQLTYYEEDEDEEEAEEVLKRATSKKSRSLPRPKVQPQDLDEDLILTDEEQEYNPHANPDLSKMTERQRSRYLEEIDNKQEYVELNDQNNVKKGSRPRRKETEQEELLRKAESARRRQDHKNKQEEEEKRDTINKLLKRRANKTRTVDTTEGTSDVVKVVTKPRRPISQHPALSRYINTVESSALAYNYE